MSPFISWSVCLSSRDIWCKAKQYLGPKNFWVWPRGQQSWPAEKMEYLEIWNFWIGALKLKKGPSFGLMSHKYSSYLSNAKDLRLFAQKLAELEQFSFGPLDFSEILNSRIWVSKFAPRPKFWGQTYFFLLYVRYIAIYIECINVWTRNPNFGALQSVKPI